MLRDLFNSITPSGVNVITGTNNTAVASGIVNTKGYDSLTFLIATGILADADTTFAVTLVVGDDPALSDGVSLTDAANADDLIGTLALAGFSYAKDNSCFKVGYKGTKQYAQLTVTPSANADSAPIAIIPLLGHPHRIPTANPPA